MKKNAIYTSLIFITGLFFLSCTENFQNPLKYSRWEMYQYSISGLASPLNIQDTLFFYDEPELIYNGNQTTYRIYQTGSTGLSFQLAMDNTRFGNIVGTVQVQMIEFGEISGVSFSQLGNQNPYIIWMRKID
jgi:hypothetical protein